MTDHSIPSERSRADALIGMRRHGEAILLYRKLVEDCPEEESHLFALAWALHDSGEPDEAAGCFERLFQRELARRLVTTFAYDELVRLYRERGNWQELISVCERAAAMQPEDAGLQRILGEAYLDADRIQEAQRVFERLVSLEPDAPGNWCALGNARLAAGDAGGAEEAYIQAARIDPAAAPLFFHRLADLLLRRGYHEQAQALFERCAAMRPAEPAYLLGLGDVLVRRGILTEAEDAYARAAALNPAAAGTCWFRMGNSLSREGFHSLAAEAFRKAITAEPENPRYFLRMATSCVALGMTDHAEAALRRAKSIMQGRQHEAP